MNQFIVSQWFEYKDDLKSFFEDSISEAERTHVLFQGWNYPRVYIPDIFEEVINHLLEHVINRGEDSLELRLVDSVYNNFPDTCCYDTMFWLRDKRGDYWMASTFYGTFESLVSLDYVGMTKDLWVTLLMHLSLGFVQKLKRCDELSNNSFVVLRHSSYNCGIRQLIDLKGLGEYSDNRLQLSYALEDLPRKSFDPLFELMTDEQKEEIKKILDKVDAKEEEQLSKELKTLRHPEWKLALMGIGEERAKQLANTIGDFGLKGYVAICFRHYCPEPFGYYQEHHSEKSFEMMEEYANKFNGDSYFIAVGSTLTKLLNDIEKRALEFEKSDLYE